MLANRGLIPAKDQLKHRCKLLEAEWQKIKKDISRKKDCSLTTRLNNISFVKLQK